MKKLIFLLVTLLFAACGPKTSCVLAQFPPQIVYAGAGCTAPLPNYVPRAVVTGGCTGFVVTQTPAAGTMLTSTNKTISVILKATGTNGKTSQVTFVVNLADTITPRISTLTPLAFADTLVKKSNDLYDIADRMVGNLEHMFNATFPFDQHPGVIAQNEYHNRMLVTVSMDDSTNFSRKRFATYMDSLRLDWDFVMTP
jgi:hypothetical protein